MFLLRGEGACGSYWMCESRSRLRREERTWARKR